MVEDYPGKELVFTNYFGVSKHIREMDTQHIANVLWFSEVFNGCDRDYYPFFCLGVELAGRTESDVRLPWKPLPIPKEIESLVRMGLVMDNGDIIGNSNCSIYEGKVIGSITHIDGWKEFLKQE